MTVLYIYNVAASTGTVTIGANSNGSLNFTIDPTTANLSNQFANFTYLGTDSSLGATYSYNGGTYFLSPQSGLANTVTTLVAASGSSAAAVLACFVSGTLIATPDGPVAVEALRVGGSVITASGGVRPIVWIGHRDVDLTRHGRPDEVMPVRVSAHAFGRGLPSRDLFLSPEHAVFAGGALIPVQALINGTTIAQVVRDAVTYWHIELDRHDVVLAEDLPVESFLENGNREDFEGQAFLTLHPGFAGSFGGEGPCAPVVRQGAIVEEVRQALMRQAPMCEAAVREAVVREGGDSRLCG